MGSPALLPLLLPLRPGVCRARGRQGPVLRQDLAGAVVQERAWLPDRTDPEAAAQTRRTVAVLAAYVLCWAPYYGFILVRDFHPTLISRDRNSLVAFYIIECTAMSNGVINTLFRERPQQRQVHADSDQAALEVCQMCSGTTADKHTSSLRMTEDVECTRLR